jgi:hypothetical protein
LSSVLLSGGGRKGGNEEVKSKRREAKKLTIVSLVNEINKKWMEVSCQVAIKNRREGKRKKKRDKRS